MIEHKTKLYICELHNVESHAGQLDFGNGLKLKQLAWQLVRRIDRATRRFPGRWEGRKPWFLVNEHLANGSLWVDGDPSGALRAFKITLALYFGERVLFGPDAHVSKQLQRYTIGPIVYRGGQLSQIAPVCKPHEFTITQDDVTHLRTLFEHVVRGFKARLVRVAIERFITASRSVAVPSDTIIDQSIALEALYLEKNDRKKQKPLAKRGATFSGVNSANREQIYLNLRCFYQARNSVIHEGEEHPIIVLKGGVSKGCVELRDWCFQYLRDVIRKLLGDNKYLQMEKRCFIQQLDKTAKQWASDFACIDGQFFFDP